MLKKKFHRINKIKKIIRIFKIKFIISCLLLKGDYLNLVNPDNPVNHVKNVFNTYKSCRLFAIGRIHDKKTPLGGGVL